ncbi:MAG: hypothetical protein HOD85_09240 [Deltaproteobacteria bacterium]|nr:hypothetical protein [Deltaproteobacteria bacterium]
MENTNVKDNTNAIDTSIYTERNLKKIAIELHRQGFNIIPLGGYEEVVPDWFQEKHDGKNEQEIRIEWCKTPRVKWRELRDDPVDRRQIEQCWNKYPNANIGIITEDLVVIDSDNAEMVKWCKENTPSQYKVKTSKGYHFYFRANSELDIRNSSDKDLKLDIRAKGGYIVAAGSIHGSGNQYQLELGSDTFETVDDLPMMTLEIWDKVQRLLHPENRTGSDRITEKASLTEEHPEHGYNNHLTRLVGKWIYEGHCESQLYEKANSWDSKAHDPMGKSAVDKVVKSVMRTHKRNNPDHPIPIEPLDSVIVELNEKHFIVPVGKKVRIAYLANQCDSTKPKLVYLTQEDFKLLYSNRYIDIGNNRSRKLGDHWLGHFDRRKHDGVVFKPTDQETDGRFYNLWNGFDIDEKKLKSISESDCQLWLDFIFRVICCSDTKLTEYVLNWMAHLVQFPALKNGVALVLKSEEQGTGKTFFVEHFGSIFGEHFFTVSDPKFLTGSFNDHMRNAILCGVEEGFWSGDVKSKNILKDMITGRERVIEQKGVDVETKIANSSRFIFTSNMDHAVAVESRDRRFQIIKVSAERMNNRSYFKNIDDEWNTGGKEAFFTFLKNRDISEFDFINGRILNEETLEQKRLSWSNEDKWLFELLYEGGISSHSDFEGYAFEYDQENMVSQNMVYQSYLEYMSNARKKGKLDKRELSCYFR